MSVKVLDCLNDLVATLQNVKELTGKAVLALDEEDFTNRITGLRNFPGAGVIYEGIHSVGDPGPSARVGVSGELVASVVLIDHGPQIRRTDQNKATAITLLDTIRATIIGTRSPTGHFWRFLLEAPALVKDGGTFWVQRYSTPIQTRPANTPS